MKIRQEREFALKIIFSKEFNSEPWHKLVELLKEEEQNKATDFAQQLIAGSLEHKQEIDAEIKRKLKNWDINRVAIMDRVILRMAITEFLYFEEIPPEVTMNEAIELAKIYSTERSGKFINGILDAVFKTLKKENKIEKSGRGLVSKIRV